MERPLNTSNQNLTELYKFHHLGEQLRLIKPPYSGIDFAIKDMNDHLAIVVKEEQIMQFSPERQVSIMEWLQKLRVHVESYGIRCEFMGRKYRGN